MRLKISMYFQITTLYCGSIWPNSQSRVDTKYIHNMSWMNCFVFSSEVVVALSSCSRRNFEFSNLDSFSFWCWKDDSEMMKNSWKIYGNAIFDGNSMEIVGIFCVMKFANSSLFPWKVSISIYFSQIFHHFYMIWKFYFFQWYHTKRDLWHVCNIL